MGARVVKRPVNGLYVHPVEDGCAPNFFSWTRTVGFFSKRILRAGYTKRASICDAI